MCPRRPCCAAVTPQLSALYFIPVNLICLLWLRRRLLAVGSSLKELAGYEPGRLGRDALTGLLWLFVLFIPFVIAVNLGMLLLFGPGGMLTAYERVFGAQHTLLAPTTSGMLVYAAAFTCWGLGAGLIYRRQGRLLPVMFAHLYTNLMFAVFPLLILLFEPF